MPASSAPHERRYWAFISYSSRDARYATRLHGLIESYGIPTPLWHSSLRNGLELPRQVRPVFRDRDELPAAADLGAEIEVALADSRHLIVLCSQASAQSPWVNREIRRFRELRPDGNVIAVRLRPPSPGESPESVIPPAVHEGSADTIDGGRDSAPTRDTALSIIARLCGIEFDVLKRFDLQRQSKRTTLASAASLGIAAFLGVATWYALHQRREALLAQQRSSDLLQFTIEQVYPAVAAIGRTDILQAVQLQVTANLDGEKPPAQTTTARNLLHDAALRLKNADVTNARRLCEEALALVRPAGAGGRMGVPQANIAVDASRELANCGIITGDLALAKRAFRAEAEALQTLRGEPLTKRFAEHGLITNAAAQARAHAHQGDVSAARAALANADVLIAAARQEGRAEEWLDMLDDVEKDLCMSRGELEYLFGDLDVAAAAYRRALDTAERQLATDRRNPHLLGAVAAACEGVGAVLLVRQEWPECVDVLRRCQAFRGSVAALDVGDSHKRFLLAISDNNLGEALFGAGDVAASLESFAAAQAMLDRLCAEAPGNPLRERVLVVCELNRAGSLRGLERYEEAYAACDKARTLCSALMGRDDPPQEIPIDLAREAYQRGKIHAVTGRRADAQAEFDRAREILGGMPDDDAHPAHRDAASLSRLLEAE